MKTNVEMKSTLDEKEDVIMTNWKDVVLREAPKTLAHENLAITNTTNGEDAKEQYEIKKRNNNVIRGMLEDESKNITKFFDDQFAMRDVTIYAAHRVGKKRLEGTFFRLIVCAIIDKRK